MILETGLKMFFSEDSPELTVTLTAQIGLLLRQPPLVVNLKDVNEAESEVKCGVAADCL